MKKKAQHNDRDDLSASASRKLNRELHSRIKDLENPIRYALASEFTRRFILFYDITDDVYVMNEPEKGTLFKRREAAESVKKPLGKHTVIIKFTKKGGKLRRLSSFRGLLSAKARLPRKRKR